MFFSGHAQPNRMVRGVTFTIGKVFGARRSIFSIHFSISLITFSIISFFRKSSPLSNGGSFQVCTGIWMHFRLMWHGSVLFFEVFPYI